MTTYVHQTDEDNDQTQIDYNLPGRDGLAILAAVHTVSPALDVLFMTASDEVGIEQKAADAGATLNLGDVYKANAYTVVWFYPKALTGGCTKQGCSRLTRELQRAGIKADAIYSAWNGAA